MKNSEFNNVLFLEQIVAQPYYDEEDVIYSDDDDDDEDILMANKS